jgi:hypothetical protein
MRRFAAPRKRRTRESEGNIFDSKAPTSAKVNYKKAVKAIDDVTLAITMEGVKSFEMETSSPTKLDSHGKKSSRPK